MTKFLKNKIFITLALIFLGTLSILINLSINYEISFSRENKKAYDIKRKLSMYPRPLVIFSKTNLKNLSSDELIQTQTWLDENNFSNSDVKLNKSDLNILVKYSNNFSLAKYLNKISLLSNTKIKKIFINFKNREIQFILGTSKSL